MGSLFCCSNVAPYRPRILDHESKFTQFVDWAKLQKETSIISTSEQLTKPSYAIQVVCQINYGPQEWIRYFIPHDCWTFSEVNEKQLIDANFQKLNSYKNFRCSLHNKFFEINLYQIDPINKHHWRATIARPAAEIDLPQCTHLARQEETAKPQLSPVYSDLKVGDTLTRKCLENLLPRICSQLKGDILSLVTLDILNSRWNVGVDLSAAWKVNLTATNVVSFVQACSGTCGSSEDCGLTLDMEKQEVAGFAKELVDNSMKNLCHGVPLATREALVDLLQSMANKEPPLPASLILKGSLRKALLFAKFGPDIEGGTQQVITSDALGREGNTKSLGAKPKSRCSSPVLSYTRFNDSDYDYCISAESSPRDYTACSLEDCGYCGHCDY
ncbi:hypothetical protein McanMca71_007700 [Microsporum canis]